MKTNCPNCSGLLRFDPAAGKLVCDYCGSIFDAEQEEPKPKTPRIRTTYKADIFRCGNCGAEIIVTNTELATKCIYCGSPSIKHDRIEDQLRPDFIIPFKLDKQAAVNRIKHIAANMPYIAPELLNIDYETIRGIYIPYYVMQLRHDEALVVEHQPTKNSGQKRIQFITETFFDKLPVEASTKLPDEGSDYLDPFLVEEAQPFSEDYLTGFYADIKDLDEEQAKEISKRKCTLLCEQKILDSLGFSYVKKVTHRKVDQRIDPDIDYVLMPVWFLTYIYKGEPHTILINGQTGRVVCGFPYDERRVKSTMTSLTFGLSFAWGVVGIPEFIYMLQSHSFIAGLILGAFWVGFGWLMSYAASSNFNKYKKAMSITRSPDNFSFVKKRQE